MIEEAGHKVVVKKLIPDDIYRLRAIVSTWAIEPDIEVIISTGGTGFGARDNTPEAISPLLDKRIEGFGELFRAVSFEQIGASTIQSRAFAGFINEKPIFCLPGSKNACHTGWNIIIKSQLDKSYKPCNFAELLPRFKPLATNSNSK